MSAVTTAQGAMLDRSGFDPRDGQGFGVELRGASDWIVARQLEKKGLGWIEGDPGDGMFFANGDGVRSAPSFEPEPDFYDCGTCYGNGCWSCGGSGRVESATHREDREAYEDWKADAIRKGEWA